LELRLQQSATTLTAPDATETPVLVVNLGASQVRTGGTIGVSFDIELVQFVRLSRDASIGAPAITWSTSATGVVDGSMSSEGFRARLTDRVRDAVDRFINAYLEENPPR
jgi:hypothetical protein